MIVAIAAFASEVAVARAAFNPPAGAQLLFETKMPADTPAAAPLVINYPPGFRAGAGDHWLAIGGTMVDGIGVMYDPLYQFGTFVGCTPCGFRPVLKYDADLLDLWFGSINGLKPRPSGDSVQPYAVDHVYGQKLSLTQPGKEFDPAREFVLRMWVSDSGNQSHSTSDYTGTFDVRVYGPPLIPVASATPADPSPLPTRPRRPTTPSGPSPSGPEAALPDPSRNRSALKAVVSDPRVARVDRSPVRATTGGLTAQLPNLVGLGARVAFLPVPVSRRSGPRGVLVKLLQNDRVVSSLRTRLTARRAVFRVPLRRLRPGLATLTFRALRSPSDTRPVGRLITQEFVAVTGAR